MFLKLACLPWKRNICFKNITFPRGNYIRFKIQFYLPFYLIYLLSARISMQGKVTSRNHQAYSRGHLVHYNAATSMVPYGVQLCQFNNVSIAPRQKHCIVQIVTHAVSRIVYAIPDTFISVSGKLREKNACFC